MRSKVLFTLIFFISLTSAAAQTKIGVSIPLTGQGASSYGYDILKSLKFANEELFGGRYDLRIQDDECAARPAVSAAKKLVELENVQYVLGLACSTAVLSTKPVYENAKVVLISSGAGSPKISGLSKYVFRTYPSTDSGCNVLGNFIAARHKRLGIISEQTDYAQGILLGMTRALLQHDVELVSVSYSPGISDFRNELRRIRAGKVDAILLNPQSEEGLIPLVIQLAQSGWKIPTYGFVFPSSRTFLQNVGGQADGIIFPDTPSFDEMADDSAKLIYQKFVRKYGRPKSSDIYFSTSLIAFQALDQAIQSREDVRQFLASNSIETLHGNFSFDTSGDLKGFSYVLKTIVNGRSKLLDKTGD